MIIGVKTAVLIFLINGNEATYYPLDFFSGRQVSLTCILPEESFSY